ncbi:MAG: hypothetical protein K2K14_01145 [Ruminococcus sp.]|nr:hypothetical protein [Ruminococcus sp.]
MALATDKIAVITENLTDAGLDKKSIAECLKMLDERQFTALEKFLISHRKKLLDSVHKYDKQIDCLDYFTYTLRKSLEVE